MSEDELLTEILRLSRVAAQRHSEQLKLEVLKFWQQELEKPRNTDPKRLLRHGFKLYSQNDEDGIIQEILHRIGTHTCRFVEFGVQNGAECNTAKLLIEGWRGLWLEADSRACSQIQQGFAGFLSEGQLTLSNNRVTAENINALLTEAGYAGDLDVLSIDIDFNDYWVWKAIEVTKPRVVVIEYNASLRPPLSLVVPYSPDGAWSGGNYFGASLEALVRLGRSKGYSLVGCCFAGVNAFFVRSDLCGDFFLQPSTADEHFEPARYFANSMPAGHRGRPGIYLSV